MWGKVGVRTQGSVWNNVGGKGNRYRCEGTQKKREPRDQESEFKLETAVTQESIWM